jgi:hypothetical protein
LFDIDNVIISAASLSLVINSTFKFFIYLSISPGYFFFALLPFWEKAVTLN